MELKQKKDMQAAENPYAAPESAEPRRVREPEVLELPLPGNGRRGLAFLIDLVVAYSIVIALVVPISVLEQWIGPGDFADLLLLVYVLIALGFPVLYHALMEGSALQASVGKLLLGLRVVHDDTGERLSYSRAFFRALVRGLLSASWIFWIVVLLSRKRQGLWDMIAKARVVAK
jgi:uncharacterized RDD family membrane protein YckC